MSSCFEEFEIPVSAGPTQGRDGLFSQVGYAVGLVLFGLTAGDDDRSSAEDEHSANDVEDRGTDAICIKTNKSVSVL